MAALHSNGADMTGRLQRRPRHADSLHLPSRAEGKARSAAVSRSTPLRPMLLDRFPGAASSTELATTRNTSRSASYRKRRGSPGRAISSGRCSTRAERCSVTQYDPSRLDRRSPTAVRRQAAFRRSSLRSTGAPSTAGSAAGSTNALQAAVRIAGRTGEPEIDGAAVRRKGDFERLAGGTPLLGRQFAHSPPSGEVRMQAAVVARDRAGRRRDGSRSRPSRAKASNRIGAATRARRGPGTAPLSAGRPRRRSCACGRSRRPRRRDSRRRCRSCRRCGRGTALSGGGAPSSVSATYQAATGSTRRGAGVGSPGLDPRMRRSGTIAAARQPDIERASGPAA